MGAAAKQVVKARFNKEVILRKLFALYDEVCGND
jgi:hypothetical protein